VSLKFTIGHTDGKARVGRVVTAHGEYETPAFMPVGTRAAVKGIVPELLRGTGAQIILANTYHLVLRPGSEIVAMAGGSISLWAGRGRS